MKTYLSLCVVWRFVVALDIGVHVCSAFSSNKAYLETLKKNQVHQTLEFSTVDEQNTQPEIQMNTPARQSLPDHLRLEDIPGKGLGVIANTRIPADSMVGDYKGEVMDTATKDRRYLESKVHLQTMEDLAWKQSRIDRGQTITGTYLYGIQVPNGEAIYVDAEDEYYSLWTRFLNHASPPHNNVNPKSIHESWNGEPRVWFVALRDIEPGEEICFDYGDDYWLPEDEVV